ncbi:unnamed protein product [Sphagnum balticum]
MAQLLLFNSTSVVRHIPAFFDTGLRPASSMKQVQSIPHGCAEKRRRTSRRSSLKSVRALLNPGDDPILKEVLKVPDCSNLPYTSSHFILNSEERK